MSPHILHAKISAHSVQTNVDWIGEAQPHPCSEDPLGLVPGEEQSCNILITYTDFIAYELTVTDNEKVALEQ